MTTSSSVRIEASATPGSLAARDAGDLSGSAAGGGARPGLPAGIPTELLIGGRWRSGSTGGTFAVTDPATGEVLTEVADASVPDAVEALGAAVVAQRTWGTSAPRERAEVLRASYEAIIARTDEIARVMTLEMGKPLAEARAEVVYGAEFFRWFAEQAAHLHGDYGPSPDGTYRILTTKQPVGPCLLITPWNFPLAMGTRKMGAALAAGCTLVMKPAAQTPLTMLLLAQVLGDAGLPDGVVNVVPTQDAAAQSSALMADARLRKVSFTGSTPVGSLLLKQAADRVLRSSMELGGNGPFLVFDDADVDAAVEGALVAKLRNGGESCVAANRFLVQQGVADEFAREFTARVAVLRTGHGLDEGTDIGPLIDERQRDKVAELVRDAVERGAQVRCGGEPVDGPGWFYRPTVLTDVPLDARLRTEEIFGPVAPIFTFATEDEGVALANDTEFGLVAYAYTRDTGRALRVAERLEAGMVGLNRGLVSNPAGPFGGVKASGLGREGGSLGIEEYLETKYIALGV